MATVYLHIGLHKTGTTSLQDFLNNNSEVLNAHGIVYPQLGFSHAQPSNPKLKIHPRRNGHFLIMPAVVKKKDSSELEEINVYEKGLDALEKLGQTYDKIILSDEDLWLYIGRHKEFLPHLRDELKKRGMDTKIIFYLRRQDLWVQSFWAQKAKTSIPLTFYQWLEQINYPLDFYKLIKKMEKDLGREALTIRIFERGQFIGKEKTLHSDFLEIFGLSLSDGFILENEFYNTRMEGYYLEIKRILNHLKPEFFLQRHPLILSLIEMQDRNPFEESYKDYTFFEPQDQIAYLKQFEESNRRVAMEYLGKEDGVLFHEKAPVNLTKFEPSTRKLLEHTLLVYGKMFDVLVEENKKRIKENQKLEKENQKLAQEIQKLTEEHAALRRELRDVRENVVLYRLKRKAKHITGKDK